MDAQWMAFTLLSEMRARPRPVRAQNDKERWRGGLRNVFGHLLTRAQSEFLRTIHEGVRQARLAVEF